MKYLNVHLGRVPTQMFWFSKLVLIFGILQEEVMTSHEVSIHEKLRTSLIRRYPRTEVPKKNIFLHNFPFKKKSYITKPYEETYEETKNILKSGNNNNLLSLFGKMNNNRANSSRSNTQPIFFNRKKLLKNIRKGHEITNKYFRKLQKNLYKSIKHLSILKPHTNTQNSSSDALIPDLYSCRSYHLDGRDYLFWAEGRLLIYCPHHKVCTQKYESTQCFKFRCKNKLIGIPIDGGANIYALCRRKRPPLIFMCPNGFIFHEIYQSCLPKCNASVFNVLEGCEKFYKCVAEYQDSNKKYQGLYEKVLQFIYLNFYKCLQIISTIDETSENIINTSISFESPKHTLISVTAKITTPVDITSSSTFSVTPAPSNLLNASHGFSQTKMNRNETAKNFKENENNLAIIYIHSADMDNHIGHSKMYTDNHTNEKQNSPSSDHKIISASENTTIFIISKIRPSDLSSNNIEQPKETNNEQIILYRINGSGAFSISDGYEVLDAETYISSTLPLNDGNVQEEKLYITKLPNQKQLFIKGKGNKRRKKHLKENKLKYFYNETLDSISAGNMKNLRLDAEFSIISKNKNLTSYISSPSTLTSKDFFLPSDKSTTITGSPPINATERFSMIPNWNKTLNILELNNRESFMNYSTTILPNTLSKTIFFTPLSTESGYSTEQDINTESGGGANIFIDDYSEVKDSENGTRPKGWHKEQHLLTDFDIAKNNDVKISLGNKEYLSDLRTEGETHSTLHFEDDSNEWEEEMDTETIPQDEETEMNVTTNKIHHEPQPI